MKKLLYSALAVLALSVLCMDYALAQTATTTTEPSVINVGKIVTGTWSEMINELVKGVIGIIAAFAIYVLKTKWDLQIEASHRQAFQTALTNAASLGLNKLGNALEGKTINLGNPALNGLAQYVVDSVPDAIKFFGLENKLRDIEEKIIAKMPQVATTTTPVEVTAAAATPST